MVFFQTSTYEAPVNRNNICIHLAEGNNSHYPIWCQFPVCVIAVRFPKIHPFGLSPFQLNWNCPITAQICDNRKPTSTTSAQQRNTPCKADNPRISQSCRQDSTSTVPSPSSTADVCSTFKRWDDNRAAATDTSHYQQLLSTDDYFKTNLTDDKFLSANVNIACNSNDGQQQQQQQQQLRSVDPRGTTDSLMVNRCHRAPSGVQNFNSLHKSIDAFLAAERQLSPKCSSVTTGDPAPPSPPPPPPTESKNSTHYISFTDGDYIFGPYDARSEEFQRFDLWGGDFHKRQNCCCHHRPCKKRSPSGTSDGSSSSTSTGSTLCLECQQRSSVTSSETLKEAESETSKSAQQQKANQVENYDDTPRIGRLILTVPSHAVRHLVT